MIPEAVQVGGTVVSSAAAAVAIFLAGRKSANGKNGYISLEQCHHLHGQLSDRLTYMQFLMMEITTEEQQEEARRKKDIFKTKEGWVNGRSSKKR